MWWKLGLLALALGVRIVQLKATDTASKLKERHPLPPHKPKWKDK